MRFIRRLTPLQLLGSAIGLTIIIGALWILGLQVIGRPTTRDELWSMLEGLSSAMALAVVAGGGVVVLSQLVEAVDNRHMQIFDRVFTEWMADEHIEARRFIYRDLPDDPVDWYHDKGMQGQDQLKMVLNAFDYLGFLIDQQWASEGRIVEWVSPIVVRCWHKLGAYVEYERRVNAKGADYYEYAEILAQMCEEARKKRGLELDHPDRNELTI